MLRGNTYIGLYIKSSLPTLGLAIGWVESDPKVCHTLGLGLKTIWSSRTSSSSQDVRPDDPVVENAHDSRSSLCHTQGLTRTQLNSTRLSASVAGPLGG